MSAILTTIDHFIILNLSEYNLGKTAKSLKLLKFYFSDEIQAVQIHKVIHYVIH